MKQFIKRISCIVLVMIPILMIQIAWDGDVNSQTMAASIPSDAVYYNDHAYKIYNNVMTWNEAKSFCESLGGHLITITNEEEQNVMENILNSTDLQYEGYWMGAYYQDTFDWHWITNETYEYEHFSSGEPNGSGQYMQTFTSGEWDDTTIDGSGNSAIYNHGLICEWEHVNGSNPSSNNGMLMWYKFENDLVNSADGKNGTKYGDVTFEDGVSGRSIYLDGDGDYIDIGTGYNLFGDFTFNVWIKTDGGNANRSDAAILAKYKTNRFGPYDFYLSYNRPAFWASDGKGDNEHYISDTTLESNKWYMLTYKYDRNDKLLSIYINGKLDTSFSCIPITFNDDTVDIGRQEFMFSPYQNLQYKGWIDELRLYNYLVSDNEISDLYAAVNRNSGNNSETGIITELQNYRFSYNGNIYTSTAYNDFIGNDSWSNVLETTIKSGKFDWLNAITSTISINGGGAEDALKKGIWDKSEFYSDPNNSAAISKINTGLSIVQLVNGFITGGRSGITDIDMKLQNDGSNYRMLLLYGSPIEYTYAGKTLWLHEILTNAHVGDAAYFLWASDDEDKIIRSCFDGLKESGTYSMKITYANVKSIEKCPYKYAIVISDDKKVYQYPILHNGTKMEVYYKPDGGFAEFAFDATQLVNSEKIEISEQVSSDIISFLTAGEWMTNSGDWLNEMKTQSITGTKNFIKTIGCKAFSLKAKAKTSLSYTSDHPSIASVDAKGKVTVHSVGKTTITITAAQTKRYAPAIRKVTVTVKPKTTKISLAKRTASTEATVTWNVGSNIDGYKIQLSKNTRFTSPRTFSASGQNRTYLQLKNLTSKKTYYVRVCTYKTVDGIMYQSDWSKYKKIKVY